MPLSIISLCRFRHYFATCLPALIFSLRCRRFFFAFSCRCCRYATFAFAYFHFFTYYFSPFSMLPLLIITPLLLFRCLLLIFFFRRHCCHAADDAAAAAADIFRRLIFRRCHYDAAPFLFRAAMLPLFSLPPFFAS